MVSRDDVESFLIRMDLDWEEVGEGMFLVRDREESPPVVIHHSPPFLLLQIKVMDLPEGEDLTELYRTLLELNASDVVHGAYGIEEPEVLLTDTLQLEALDFVEFQSTLESLQLAISSHMERLGELASKSEEA